MDERRKSLRGAKLATGQIVFDSTVLHCAIVDLSDHGACLEVSMTQELPSEFVLRLTEGNRRQCQVAWRDHNRVGVEFRQDEPVATGE